MVVRVVLVAVSIVSIAPFFFMFFVSLYLPMPSISIIYRSCSWPVVGCEPKNVVLVRQRSVYTCEAESSRATVGDTDVLLLLLKRTATLDLVHTNVLSVKINRDLFVRNGRVWSRSLTLPANTPLLPQRVLSPWFISGN
jgi:hypothetical protein